jgi:broad specificity phosphatase PhoE
MPPKLILIRHAQAQHNATSDWSIRDPPLTELGEQQSRELHESLKQSEIGNQVELIVVSAQRRTLQTATIGLDWLIKKGIKGKTRPLHQSPSSAKNANQTSQSSPTPTGKKTPTNPATQARP